MWKSDDCTKNEHGGCKGFTTETADNSSTLTRICSCACHEGTYQLVRNSVALMNQSARENPYQFSAGNDDV